ncbi:MAG: hypothetical protein LBF41_05520 [Deltaproteobacteria bacterium]|jgi:hypothetical protein|nr:hypothetical protein [Deltaproteobacteria bacterium]
MTDPSTVEIAKKISSLGGRVLVAGGAARDFAASGLFAREKRPGESRADVDLCAFGLSLDKLRGVLSDFGQTVLIRRKDGNGPSGEGSPLLSTKFPGFRLETGLPKDKTGLMAEKPFTDANLREDAEARDFTLNAIYLDPLTDDLIDPLGGLAHLERRTLAPAHPGILESDPVRALRAMSLISRKSFTAHPSLLKLAGRDFHLLSKVPKTRQWREWAVWAASPRPHLGLHFLKESGLVNFYPELKNLGTLPQGERFHPEGNVWNHTVLVVEAMEKVPLPDGRSKVTLFFAALLHDIGKLVAPSVANPERRSRSYGDHARLGVPLANKFLDSICAPRRVAKAVARLTERHMDCAFGKIGPGALRNVARRLAPYADLVDFWALMTADWNGRRPWIEKFPLSLEEFLEPVGGSPLPPEDLVTGAELAARLGIGEGPAIGRLKRLLADAHDREQISTGEEAWDLIRKNLHPER